MRLLCNLIIFGLGLIFFNVGLVMVVEELLVLICMV